MAEESETIIHDTPLDKSSGDYIGEAPDVYEDPVCGMMVNPNERPYISRFGGTTYFFCSAECKAKFDELPSNYVGQ